MIAQFVLTPTESKKLIAKGIMSYGKIKDALNKGIVVIHPSSTTVFILEELGITRSTSWWICGLIQPEGLCASGHILDETREQSFDATKYSHSWVIEKGKLRKDPISLSELLDKMSNLDVYIKGANAIDPEGNVGILFAAKGGGTIGKVKRARKKKGFSIVIAAGWEKSIPTPLSDAIQYCKQPQIKFANGTPCGLLPLEGDLITELEAIKLLTGGDAKIVSAGGLGGAEGAQVISINGDEKVIDKAIQLNKEIKGVKLPNLYLLDCDVCPRAMCHNSKISG